MMARMSECEDEVPLTSDQSSHICEVHSSAGAQVATSSNCSKPIVWLAQTSTHAYVGSTFIH